MKHFSSLLLAGLFCWTGVQATIHQVTSDKTGAELQTVITAAESGDTIYVQAGTYQGNFTFKDGVNVSGGWNEDFSAQTDYATVLDANHSGRPVSSTANLATLTIWSNLTLQNGNPGDGGGGAHLRQNARLDHCLIQNNTTGGSGKAAGGVQLYNGGQLYNCIVRNNSATGDTGGVRLHSNGQTSATLVNCLIEGNTATNSIGGVSLESCQHYVYNNTIVNNAQNATGNPTRCGVRLNVGANLEFANNVVWGNKVGMEVQTSQMEINTNYLSSKADYFRHNAIVYSDDFGASTILLTEDPFVDAANGNYLPTAKSGLIDSGDNDKAKGDKDLAGNARIVNTTIDRGCYEVMTASPTGIANVQSDNVQCTKVIRDGQLYLMYKGTTYSIQGTIIK